MRESIAVCYINDQGELTCPTTVAEVNKDYVPALTTAIAGAIPNFADVRLKLAVDLANAVLNSELTDDCIANRSKDIVASAGQLLSPPTPVMLLYRYIALPGNILAAYYVQQNRFPSARAALDDWANLKLGC